MAGKVTSDTDVLLNVDDTGEVWLVIETEPEPTVLHAADARILQRFAVVPSDTLLEREAQQP